VAHYPKGTAYERSKQDAERLVLDASGGIDVVLVNPAGVYGTGPTRPGGLEEDFFRPLVRKRLPAVPPGGMGVCFSEGVARGHLLAAERGRPGERYILCDRHVRMRELAETVVRVAGRGRVPPTVPPLLARGLATGGELISRAIRRPPLLPTGQLHFLMWDAAPDSSKAQDELGWQPTALEEGLKRTLREMGCLD
jgi:dihydroflavonol-4-reductase